MLRSFMSVLWFGLLATLLGSHDVGGFVVYTPKSLQAGSLVSSTSIAAGSPTTHTSKPEQHLRLPLLKPWSLELQRALENSLEEIVSDTNFFLRAKCQSSQSGDAGGTSWQWQCEVPLFDADCRVLLTLQEDLSEQHPSLVLSLEDSEILSKNDFAWVCRRFYECADSLTDAGIDCGSLRTVVVDMFNQQSADPGVNAATAQWSKEQRNSFENLLKGGNDGAIDLLKELDEKGFVVIDPQTTEDEETCPLTTDSDMHEALSNYLAETTSQGDTVRTDRVHFLSREQADTCGVMQQYDLLMGIADYFNDRQDQPIPSSMYMQPVAPATTSKQLTIPRRMQFAEYALNDFYKAHSDNSLTGHLTESNDAIRRNFRAYTCILYLNDEWNIDEDGGALRLYPQSQKYHSPDEAVEDSGNNHGFVDISPNHGRLLIFDSRLVHSVEPVTTSKKVRRALTLWINRPNNSEVPGETFY